MDGSTLSILLCVVIAVLPLVVVYRSPEHNGLDEAIEGNEERRQSMNIFQKAFQGLSLTPGERALLKLLEGLLVAALVAALPVIAEALSSSGAVDWNATWHTALATGAVALLLAVLKYVKAQRDMPLTVAAPLEMVLQSAADRLSVENGLNEPVIEQEIDTLPEPPEPPGAASAPAQAA